MSSSDEESQTRNIEIPRKEIENIISGMLDQKLSKLNYMTLEDGKALVLDALGKMTRILADKGMLSMQGIKSVTHNPQEFMPAYVKKYLCPDCGGKPHDNPNYEQADYYCSDCGHPFGTADQARAAESCPECGSKGNALRVIS